MLEGQANVLGLVAYYCYNESGSLYNEPGMPLKGDGPFTFSDTRNKFTAIGCDTLAYTTSYSRRNFTSGNFTRGCVSVCWKKESVIDGNCSGIGCCRTSIPKGATSFYIQLESFYNHTSILDFNPCSFAFLIADDDQFKFNISDLSAGSQYGRKLGEKVKKCLWCLIGPLGNETCAQAKENPTSYACKSSNGSCYEPTNGPGYRCNCPKELLTGEKPICMNRSQEERSLSMYFVKSLKEHRLFQVLENRIVDEGGVDQLVAVAELAKRCLKVKGEERPSMKEVAMEQEGLRRAVEHPWVQKNHEETQSLLGETSAGYNGNGSVIGQDSLTNHNMSALEIGR
ncbi:wall-associated receptor kinase 2 [Cinnamomum micranthum f. kanehirae]|uniref:Wall-associated receptor kinase 2 n=1 Tax=Cinnamomum micranthum f. kanehirae TaxID=337451 RepID=A0A443NKE3_9MAGN|nr:wall-associated receptor kinase 2 [Cinnamomum micranthum f. kanehirae]